jgi:hypothetical protein
MAGVHRGLCGAVHASDLLYSRVRHGRRPDELRRQQCRPVPYEKDPGDTNRDRKCARESLRRCDIAIANREAGDEGEIDRIADGPPLKKANREAKGNLDREYYR